MDWWEGGGWQHASVCAQHASNVCGLWLLDVSSDQAFQNSSRALARSMCVRVAWVWYPNYVLLPAWLAPWQPHQAVQAACGLGSYPLWQALAVKRFLYDALLKCCPINLQAWMLLSTAAGGCWWLAVGVHGVVTAGHSSMVLTVCRPAAVGGRWQGVEMWSRRHCSLGGGGHACKTPDCFGLRRLHQHNCM